ncbi:hypothetical protein P3L10_003279 [Capsicum annuum]
MLLGLFRNDIGCVLDSSEVVRFWRIQQEPDSISGECKQMVGRSFGLVGWSTLLGLFKNDIGCVSEPSKVVRFWRIQHGCGNISGESE